MKVLSIDYDYFPIVDKDILYKFPDGVDQPAEISRIVWASRYATYPELKKIEINRAELDMLEKIISRQKRSTPCMIAQSHVHAYRFILDNLKDKKKVALVNADFHHDITNDNKRLDCGNWIGHLTEALIRDDKALKLDWVVNPESLNVIDGEDFRPYVKKSLSEYENTAFDAIFLCRSDNWVPPHLDKYFTELSVCCKVFTTCCMVDNLTNRSYGDYEKELRERINGLKND